MSRMTEPMTNAPFPHPLMLLPGQWVEVREASNILSTLDGDWALEGLPFMPEMLPFCGERFKVLQCAERACVYPPVMPLRQLKDCLVLEGLHCDGAAHGGCQLGCMLLWKEAWLKRVEGPLPLEALVQKGPPRALPVHREGETLVYFCQATELPKASTEGDPLWKPGQYVGFLRKRTFSVMELVRMYGRMGFRKLGRLLGSLSRSRVQAGTPDPNPLGLMPGQWVKVKGWNEILGTLDGNRMHRGLSFSGEMTRFCGRIMRVQCRVDRIMDEPTGRIRQIRDTVTLEHAICDRYRGCARGMPLLWREAWLRPIAVVEARGRSSPDGPEEPKS